MYSGKFLRKTVKIFEKLIFFDKKFYTSFLLTPTTLGKIFLYYPLFYETKFLHLVRQVANL